MFGNRGNGFPFPVPGLPGAIGPIRATTDGGTMVGTMGIRYEFPVETTRFRPYINGGLGINNTEQEFHLDATSVTREVDESSSHTGYAFSAGAGAAVRVWNSLWADVDAKYLRLSRERNVMRLGGGVSVRF
jgi:opacity protein-like surface antigen